MALSKTLSQICVLLATLCSIVSSQQATALTDANTLISKLLASLSATGHPQPVNDPNAFSSFGASGTNTLGAGAGFGTPASQNVAFPAGLSASMFPRATPQSFPLTMNAAAAPLPKTNLAHDLMQLMMMRGSDMAQSMALASMLGRPGSMFDNPLSLFSLMNSM